MSGGKGGSTTQTTQADGPQVTRVEIPKWLEGAARENLARAKEISELGYRPYYGPDVAALTPMQEAAMQSTGMAAQAYGLPNALGTQVTPEAETFAGGVRGYSSGSLYDQALAELAARNPGQYAAIIGMFIDPQTGEMVNQPAPAPAPAPTGGGGNFGNTAGTIANSYVSPAQRRYEREQEYRRLEAMGQRMAR